MTVDQVKELIKHGEKVDVEFKLTRTNLSKTLYDTVCAFNNRVGGHILLGVNDKRKIIGVDRTRVGTLIKEFTTTINNTQKISPALYITPQAIEIEGKVVIYIRMPRGNLIVRHNNRIYDRIFEADIDITDHQEDVFKLYASKQKLYFVDQVFTNVKIDDLNKDVFIKARDRSRFKTGDHPWLHMSDEQILRSANLIQIDEATNKEGITLAGILLFGKDSTISQYLPHYKTDAIFRVFNKDRYDDREIVATNLIDSFERLLAFGQAHLHQAYGFDVDQTVNPRDLILREIISNTLAHRDNASNYTAKMVIEEDKIKIENSNVAKKMQIIDVNNFTPLTKNPAISKVFREIGLADELGSGTRKTYKYTKLYSDSEPILEEGSVFKTIIPLKPNATFKVGDSINQSVVDQLSKVETAKVYDYSLDNESNNAQDVPIVKYASKNNKNSNIVDLILKKILANNKITRMEIAKEVGLSVKSIQKYIKRIPGLKFVGSGNHGHWVVKK